MGFADFLSSEGGGGLIGGVLSLLSNIGAGARMRKQIETQEGSQKRLNEAAAKTNYEYGETAAQNAYQRMLEQYQREYKDQSYGAMRGQMEDAGLSVGLMYGGGGASGGGTGSTGGGIQGETGGAQAGQAVNPASLEALNMQRKMLGLQMANAVADLDLKKANAKKAEADADSAEAAAEKAKEETETIKQRRATEIEELRQRGIMTWIENVVRKYKAEHGDELTEERLNRLGRSDMEINRNEALGTSFGLWNGSYIDQEEAVKLRSVVATAYKDEESGNAMEALAKLNNEKANGYWAELINATMHAEAHKAEAAAKKLAAEWSTGEYTNWKTWVSTAEDAVNTLANGVGAVYSPTKKIIH